MVYLNGRLLTKSRALISVFDHGFLYGDGIYETLRVYGGVVFRVEEHVERLFRSASLIGLRIGKSQDEIRKAIYKTVRANRRKEASVRISVSRGPGPLGLDPSLCLRPTIVIVANPLREYPDKYYRKGVKVAIVRTRRNFRGALDPRIKSLNFLNNILAKREAIERGAYEAIMLNYRGYVTEGTISNIFFIKRDALCTPAVDAGLLDGITRRIILETASDLGMEIRQGHYRTVDIYRAGEVFITNSTLEVMPVSLVDDVMIGKKAGVLTGTIHRADKRKVEEYKEAHK
jgi:branched-chain amino acid aminotransferase